MSRAFLLALLDPKLLLALVWLLLLIAGAYSMQHRPKSPAQDSSKLTLSGNACLSNSIKAAGPHVVSRRVLAVNHRVVEEDMDWPQTNSQGLAASLFLGKYLACPVRAGDAVIPKELWLSPAIKPAANKQAYLFPVKRDEKAIFDLDVDSQVDLFEDQKPLLRQIAISAIVCDSADSTSCSLILELSASDAQLLSRASPAQISIVRILR